MPACLRQKCLLLLQWASGCPQGLLICAALLFAVAWLACAFAESTWLFQPMFGMDIVMFTCRSNHMLSTYKQMHAHIWHLYFMFLQPAREARDPGDASKHLEAETACQADSCMSRLQPPNVCRAT